MKKARSQGRKPIETASLGPVMLPIDYGQGNSMPAECVLSGLDSSQEKNRSTGAR